VDGRIVQTNVLLHDATLRIQNEGSGQSGNAAVVAAQLVGSESDAIVDARPGDELLDCFGIVLVNKETENLEFVRVLFLEIDQVVNLFAAGTTPGGPEVDQNDFAFDVVERKGLAVKIGELKGWSRIGILDEANDGFWLRPGRLGSQGARSGFGSGCTGRGCS